MAEMTNAQVALEAASRVTSHFGGNEQTVVLKADIFLKWLNENSYVEGFKVDY